MAFSEAHGLTIGQQILLQIVPNRNLPRFATFFRKPQTVLISCLIEILVAKTRDGSRASRGVDQGGNDGSISQADRMRSVNPGQHASGLIGGDLGGLALDDNQAFASHRRRGIQHHDMACHQMIEEVPERRQMDFLGRRRVRPRVQIASHIPRSDSMKRKPARLRPVQEFANGMLIRSPGVCVFSICPRRIRPRQTKPRDLRRE